MSTYHKEVTDHHDGHGLAESIRVFAADEPGPGGACHRYEFFVDQGNGQMEQVGYLQFQKGPRNEEGSTPGVLTVAVLAAMIDQARDFRNGPYASREGSLAQTHMEEALHWLRARADERARRGVLGHNAK